MKIEKLRVAEKKEKRRSRAGAGTAGFCRRTRRRVHAESTPIQRLFQLCSAVFGGPGTVPSPPDVKAMQIFLERMKAEDFGLSTDLPFFKAKEPTEGTPAITYTTIHSCDNFSICIFFLPPTAVIPLHNHPGMTVFSQLLLGSMHIRSYDWAETDISEDSTLPSKFRLAKRVTDSDFTAPCKTSTLYPAAGGNIHTFRAISPCVVLDVLGPPYSKEEDRDCTYYREHPYSHLLGTHAWKMGLERVPIHGSMCCRDSNMTECNTKSTQNQRENPMDSGDLFDGGRAVSGGHGDDRIGWLEEIDVPKEMKMFGVEYLGPQIVYM
ncbi:plant cysteine oxidase 2-like [Iris pallida]|uniref:cysteine dioxygenase n=1 Tax=Iris pallida TaxID=29817 RepID=A0AAX6I1H3_IRIPA|nr:plant cysteine oxidase 2-like [Iris pallida]